MSAYEGKTIRAVIGEEPIREGEYPNQYMIGTKVNFWRDSNRVDGITSGPMESVLVTRIEHRVENRGDHGIGWFDVFASDVLVASMNERHVAEVTYDLEKQVPSEIPAP